MEKMKTQISQFRKSTGSGFRMLCLFVLALAFSQMARTQDAALKTVVDRFIHSQAVKLNGEEYADARKLLAGDVNSDGKNDAVVLYTLEAFHKTNNYIQFLAVFVNGNGRYRYLTSHAVGGKNRREVELKSISDGTIQLGIMNYGPKDPSCCPSIKSDAQFRLSSNRLVEIPGKKTR
jgi:hypothetical protein